MILTQPEVAGPWMIFFFFNKFSLIILLAIVANQLEIFLVIVL